jgi:hypothetical protein
LSAQKFLVFYSSGRNPIGESRAADLILALQYSSVLEKLLPHN